MSSTQIIIRSVEMTIYLVQVKHEVKSRLTLSAAGAEGGEGPRNHIQVLANSVVATMLSIAHAIVLSKSSSDSCFSLGHNTADILIVGIVAYVAAFAFARFYFVFDVCFIADTFLL